MTGPEHYREAERLLCWPKDGSLPHQDIAMIHAEAQVHATLALAAATALCDPSSGQPAEDWKAWYGAAGTPKSKVPPEVFE